MKPEVRDIDDDKKVREFMYRNVIDALSKRRIESRNTILEFKDVSVSNKDYSLADQKKAVLNNKDIAIPVTGTVVLRDKVSGNVIDQKQTTLGQLPYYTPRGTFVMKGNEYGVFNQVRLKPGVYTKIKTSGEAEAQFNLKPGIGRSFRIMLVPETGVFTFIIGQAKDMPVYSFLYFLRVPDSIIKEAWGEDLFKINSTYKNPLAIDKLYSRLFSKDTSNNEPVTEETPYEKAKKILDFYSKDSMDALVNQRTVGVSTTGVNLSLLLAVTKKLIQVNKRVEEPDDRDSLEFRNILGPEDYFSEQIHMDAGGNMRKTAWKADRTRNLQHVMPGFLTKTFKDFVTRDSRTATMEQLNPMEILETKYKTTPLGEGGISEDSIPDSVRNVQPSQFGFIDPVRTPESSKAGLDLKLATGTKKGFDRKLYTELLDNNGKIELVSAEEVVTKTVAFPGQKNQAYVTAMKNKKVINVPRNQVDYWLPDGSRMFTVTTNLAPALQTAQGNRVLMAAKMIPQALPMQHAEAALIRALNPSTGESFDAELGKKIAAITSPTAGRIVKITDDDITIKRADGSQEVVFIYNNFPFNRKTGIHNIPVVKVGDIVKKGDLLCKSNFSDDEGRFAYGKNLKIAYVSYKGHNFEDGIVISESAAKKLTSEHVYSFQIDKDENIITGKDAFVSTFPTAYTSDKLSTMDNDGIIKKGVKVHNGDPLILAIQERTPSPSDISLGRLHKSLRQTYRNISEEWHHHGEGEVIEVVKSAKFLKVVIRSYEPMVIGDKLAGRHGNKGVVSEIIADKDMPHGEDGKPFEVLLNPQGIITRINPSQVHETLLGKAADKLKKPIEVPIFEIGNAIDFVKDHLKKAGLPEDGTETIYDGKGGKQLGKVLTGVQYMMKTSATAEKSLSAQSTGSYTNELQPVGGGRIGNLELRALLAHGARKVLRDAMTYKGERNKEFWRAVRANQPLPPPRKTFMTDKFYATLKSAGINVDRDGSKLQIMPLTDENISELSAGKLSNSKAIRAQDFKPEEGGLFDEAITGGLEGDRWAHYELPEPMPNPIAEENIAALLDLTMQKFRDILIGNEKLNGQSGGVAIQKALAALNIDDLIEKYKKDIKTLRGNNRNKAIKKLRILLGCKSHGVPPSKFMITKVPVIPPKYRPVTPTESGTTIVADANNLYQDFAIANEEYKNAKTFLHEDDEDLKKLKEALYHSVKTLYGLESSEQEALSKGHKGFIKQILGDQPKFGMFQAKVTRKRQDLSGRAVIIPDPTLGIDEAGIPEEMAWEIYEPFIIREMVRNGMKTDEADKHLEDKDDVARKTLLKVMSEQTIMVNRAPSLHRFNIMAMKGKLSNKRVLSLPPMIEKGFNADHDGDAMNIHVLATDEAVHEADSKMLPSRNLFTGRKKEAYWLPSQEAVIGLYRATKKSDEKPVMKFKTAKEAIEAYKAGKLKITDPIEVENV